MINEETLLISDPHFSDKNVMNFCPTRIELYTKNKKANKDIDWLLFTKIWCNNKNKQIFCLGDFSFSKIDRFKKKLEETQTILLPGNHDRLKKQDYLKKGMSEVIEGIHNKDKIIETKKEYCNAYIKEILGVKIMFSHFPVFNDCKYDRRASFSPAIVELEKRYIEEKCQLNIHGHTHEQNSSFQDSFNVSVEAINFEPITVKEVLKRKGFID